MKAKSLDVLQQFYSNQQGGWEHIRPSTAKVKLKLISLM